MNASSESAEQIVRLGLEGFEVTAKIAGASAKEIAILLYTIIKNKEQTKGKTNLINMLKSGKELKVFSVKQEEFKKFSEEAKRYGILFSALNDKKNKTNDGVIDIMVKAEDASRINRIVDRFKLSSYNQATIRNEIEKTRIERSKELNPHLVRTEKSPLSEHSLEKAENLDQGTKKKLNRESVKEKLDKCKKEVKIVSKERDSKIPVIKNKDKNR